MHTIQIKDKTFGVSVPEADILAQVGRVADEINSDYAGQKPIFLVVLNGAYVFAADLLRRITLDAELRFIRVSSYQGTATTGQVNQVLGLDCSIEGRHVIVVEDIVDSGITMRHLLDTLQAKHPASLAVCTLLVKPENLRVQLDIPYWCMKVPAAFIVGYGLDYDQMGRNLRDIYALVES